MNRSFYKINIDNPNPSEEALKFKVEIQQKVNKAIDDFYYNQDGSFKNFYKVLDKIRKVLSCKVDDLQGAEEVFHQFEQDIKSFYNFSQQLQGLNKEFYQCLKNKTSKKDEKFTPYIPNIKKSKFNNTGREL